MSMVKNFLEVINTFEEIKGIVSDHTSSTRKNGTISPLGSGGVGRICNDINHRYLYYLNR